MSNKVYIIAVIVLIVLIIFLSVFLKNDNTSSYIKITGKEAVTLVENGAKIIDVRTEEEYNSGHIEDAINVPLDNLNSLELDKTDEIIVYCQTGKRSKQAANILLAKGYKVYDLGGIDNWED